MKKFVIFLLSCLLSSFVFALETEARISVAYGHGLFFEKGSEQGITAQSNIVAPGLDISIEAYFNNKNLGLYLNTAYNFPSKLTAKMNNVKVETVRSDYDWATVISAILGAAYKYDFGNISIFGAIGPHFAQTALKTKYVGVLNHSFGIGGDIGVSYFPIKNFYITGGTLLAYDFFTTGKVNTAYGSANREGRYSFFSVVPYIGVGIRYSSSLK